MLLIAIMGLYLFLFVLLFLCHASVTGGACCNCYRYEGDGGVCRVNIGLLSTGGSPVDCCCSNVELKIAGTAAVTSCGDFSPPDRNDCKRCSPPPPAPCCDCAKHGGVASSGDDGDNLAPTCCFNYLNFDGDTPLCPVSKMCKVCKPTKPKPTKKRKPTKKPTHKPTKKPTKTNSAPNANTRTPSTTTTLQPQSRTRRT